MSTTVAETNRIFTAIGDEEPDPVQLKSAISVSAETVTTSTADLPDKQRDLIRWLYGYARDMGLSWSEIAQKTTISKNTLYKVWTGKYTDADGNQVPLDGICERIQKIKALEEDREGVKPADFVETSVYKRILKVCDEARILQIVASIYGESQIGKTTAAQEVARLRNHGTTVFYRTPARAADFFPGLSAVCHKSKKQTPTKMWKNIMGYMDHSKILILDEAHLIFEIYTERMILKVMESLRELHDVKRCGLVLIGTNVFRDEMQQGKYAKMLKQLRKRGIYELQLPDVAPQCDIDLIASAYGLPPAKGDAAELVKLITERDGLGRLTKFLTKAQQMATKHNQRFTWDHFIKADTLIRKLSIFDQPSKP